MTVLKECYTICDEAIASYTGEPVPVKLPEGLTVQELHEVVAFWRTAGWSAEMDSSSRVLTLG